MSGLAVTAFVVSLVVLIALPTGWWWLTLAPFLFACFATMKAVPERYRGRGLAIAAIVICALIGIFSFMGQRAMLTMAEHVAAEVLRPLAADGIEESERDHRLKDWVREKAVTDGKLELIKERFALVVESMGPYQGRVSAGSNLSGTLPVMLGPRDPALVQVDDQTEGMNAVAPGQALWVKAAFEKGDVDVAVFFDMEADGRTLGQAIEEGAKARVVQDLRFYLPAR